MKRCALTIALLACVGCGFALAHDTWVQPNTNLIRTGDAIHIDLMLGNHGNEHRDFKLASKLSADQIQSFDVFAPDGKKYDLNTSIFVLHRHEHAFLDVRSVQWRNACSQR